MANAIMVGAGCFSLGAFIGALIVHYVANVREFTLRSLTGSVAIISGAGVIGLFGLMDKHAILEANPYYWFYPIGLAIGGGMIASLVFDNGPSQAEAD